MFIRRKNDKFTKEVFDRYLRLEANNKVKIIPLYQNV